MVGNREINHCYGRDRFVVCQTCFSFFLATWLHDRSSGQWKVSRRDAATSREGPCKPST